MVVSSYLLGLFFQASDEGLDCLIGPGLCLGVLLVTIAFVAFPDILAGIKNSLLDSGKLLRHQTQFCCHICGKPSPRPYEYTELEADDHCNPVSEFVVTDWDRPTELVQCARCHEWTCPNADPPHMENGICKYCLENRPVQVQNENLSIKEENLDIVIVIIVAIVLVWILKSLLFPSNW